MYINKEQRFAQGTHLFGVGQGTWWGLGLGQGTDWGQGGG